MEPAGFVLTPKLANEIPSCHRTGWYFYAIIVLFLKNEDDI